MKTPKGLRLHIGIVGRRNVGKSSLLNVLTRQDVSIVSEVAGTTTDPVEKPMELQPLGPVLLIDTAGMDDGGRLGALRVERSARVLDRCELIVLVVEAGIWGEYEQRLLAECQRRELAVVVFVNKVDRLAADQGRLVALEEAGVPCVSGCALTGDGLSALRQALVEAVPEEFLAAPSILADLVPPGEPAVLVVPIDKEAPRGRLIAPQVQAIRDLLDHDAWCAVVKERELAVALERLHGPPALVVTDSQAFLRVAGDTPETVPMTSFSILFARFKGDLPSLVDGALAIDRLRPGDRVLVAESCAHHPIADDIGRVKIPRWLTQYVGGELDFTTVQGHDFPTDLADYRLAVHCGGCMFNRREILGRIAVCRASGVPITNYGICIAKVLGIFARALAPFPEVADRLEGGGHGG